MKQAELDFINAGRPASETAPGKGDWKLVLKDPQILLLTTSYFCSNYVFYFFFNWLFIYLVDNRGFKVLEGGYYAAAPWITGAVGALAGGAICDRLSKRLGIRWGCRWPSLIGLLLSGALIVAAAAAGDPRLAVVLLSLCLAGAAVHRGGILGGDDRGVRQAIQQRCGVLNTGGNVVGGVGALLVPITVERLGWPAALGSAAVFALVGAALWCWIKADQRLEES